MPEHLDDGLVISHVLREDEPDGRASVEEHLRSCPRCGRAAQASREVIRLVRAGAGPHLSSEAVADHSLDLVPDADGRRRIEEHLRLCTSCRREVELLRELGPLEEPAETAPAKARPARRRVVLLAAAMVALIVVGATVALVASRWVLPRHIIQHPEEFAEITDTQRILWMNRRGDTVLTEPQPDVHSVQVCNPDGGRKNLLAMSFMAAKYNDGRVALIDRKLREKYRISVVPLGPWPWDHEEKATHSFGADWIWAGQLDADEPQEIVTAAHHENYPAKLAVYDYDSAAGDLREVGSYWHGGHYMGQLWPKPAFVIEDLSGDGRTDLAVGATNNYWPTDPWDTRALIMFDDIESPGAVAGQAPPYTGRGEPMGSEDSYWLFAPLPAYRKDRLHGAIQEDSLETKSEPDETLLQMRVQGRQFLFSVEDGLQEGRLGMTTAVQEYYGPDLVDYIATRFMGGLAGQATQCPRFVDEAEAVAWFDSYRATWEREVAAMSAWVDANPDAVRGRPCEELWQQLSELLRLS